MTESNYLIPSREGKHLGEILRELAMQKKSKVIEGYLMPCISCSALAKRYKRIFLTPS